MTPEQLKAEREANTLAAQKTIAGWSPEKRASMQLQGSSIYEIAGQAAQAQRAEVQVEGCRHGIAGYCTERNRASAVASLTARVAELEDLNKLFEKASDRKSELARECGATFYKNRHSPHEPAVAFSPTAWEKFIAAQAQRADVQGEPVAYGNSDELDNMLDDRWATVVGQRTSFHRTALYAHPDPAVASLTARVAELEALCKQAEEALHTAHDHIEMHRLDVSHIKDANLIRATLASLREV